MAGVGQGGGGEDSSLSLLWILLRESACGFAVVPNTGSARAPLQTVRFGIRAIGGKERKEGG